MRRLGELNAAPVRSGSARNSRIPIGLLLHSRGVLTKEQLQLVLERQRETGANFGEAAQQLGFASAEQVTAAVAAQWACPVFPLVERPVSSKVHIPKPLLELCGMFPVHYSESDRKLHLGFVSGLRYQVVQTVEHVAGCVVKPCFITAKDYQRLLLSHPHAAENEVSFDQPMDALEISRITKSYVERLNAERVRLGRCEDCVWVRISGAKRQMDLLLRTRTE